MYRGKGKKSSSKGYTPKSNWPTNNKQVVGMCPTQIAWNTHIYDKFGMPWLYTSPNYMLHTYT